MKVAVDDLARLIAKDLAEYSEEVELIVKDTIDAVAKEALDTLKSEPILKTLDGTGEYAKSFYISNQFKSKGKNKGAYKLILHNKKYRIGHLLEYGHAKAIGGRTRSFPHWGKAQKIVDNLENRIKEAIEK